MTTERDSGSLKKWRTRLKTKCTPFHSSSDMRQVVMNQTQLCIKLSILEDLQNMYPYQIDAADVTQWIKYPSDAFVRIRLFIPLLRRCYLQISRPASVTFRHSSRAERNRILFLCPSDNLASLLHSRVLGTRRCSGKAKFCLTGAKDFKENSYVLCAMRA